MLAIALSFLAGVVLVARLPELPPVWLIGAALLSPGVAILARWRGWMRDGPGAWGGRKILLWLAVLAFAFGWAALRAQWALSHRLDESLAGQSFRLQGRVVGLPEHRQRVRRFVFAVSHIESLAGDAIEPPPRMLRLSWYDSARAKAPRLHAG